MRYLDPIQDHVHDCDDTIEHPGAASEGYIIMSRPIREKVLKSEYHRLVVVEGATVDQAIEI